MSKSILTIAVFILFVSLPVYSEDDMLGPGNWPVTVHDTVKDILSKMSDKDKEIVRRTKKEELNKFHHGWGTGIRNYYGLWRDNKELIKSACGKMCHPDDASMVIIEAVWQELQK